MNNKTIRTNSIHAFAACLCASAFTVHAATVSVDCDTGGSVMTALAAIKPGDTLRVSGYCREHVNIGPEITGITLDGQKKATLHHPGGQALSQHAVYVRGREIIIKGFTVTGGLDGIHLSGPASAVIDGNMVQKNRGRGIHIDKGSIARILNTTIEGSGGIGISITGTSYAYIGVFIPRLPQLSPNTIRNNGGPGINIERGSGAWVVGNTITHNKGAGIAVNRNSQADVIANAISANGGDAIAVSYNGGVNLNSETRRDGPNQTSAGQNNGGVAIRCGIGGYVEGPLGTLAGAQGAKVFDNTCADRVAAAQ